MRDDTIEWRLRIGTRLSGFFVRPDSKWPGMWRIHAPNGRISDMVNLSRARDACLAQARTTGARQAGNERITWESAPFHAESAAWRVA